MLSIYTEYTRSQFGEVLLITSLAHKYMIKAIFNTCRTILMKLLPAEMPSSWLQLDDYAAFRYPLHDILRTIDVLKTVEITKALPYLYYVLAFRDQKAVSRLLFKERRLDVFEIIAACRAYVLGAWFAQLGPEILSSDAKSACVHPNQECAREEARKQSEFTKTSADLCLIGSPYTFSHPLQELWSLSVTDNPGVELCLHCSKRRWRVLVVSMQDKIWQNLPQVCGLSSWDKLKEGDDFADA
jgi:hypothetical protein